MAVAYKQVKSRNQYMHGLGLLERPFPACCVAATQQVVPNDLELVEQHDSLVGSRAAAWLCAWPACEMKGPWDTFGSCHYCCTFRATARQLVTATGESYC